MCREHAPRGLIPATARSTASTSAASAKRLEDKDDQRIRKPNNQDTNDTGRDRLLGFFNFPLVSLRDDVLKAAIDGDRKREDADEKQGRADDSLDPCIQIRHGKSNVRRLELGVR